jgi:hypothetical protein
MKMYMVNTYEEHGPEQIKVFLSRDEAKDFLVSSKVSESSDFDFRYTDEQVGVAIKSAEKEANLAVNVSNSWGEWQITCLEAEKSHG